MISDRWFKRRDRGASKENRIAERRLTYRPRVVWLVNQSVAPQRGSLLHLDSRPSKADIGRLFSAGLLWTDVHTKLVYCPGVHIFPSASRENVAHFIRS